MIVFFFSISCCILELCYVYFINGGFSQARCNILILILSDFYLFILSNDRTHIWYITVCNEPERDIYYRVSWLHLFVPFIFTINSFVALLGPCLVCVTGHDW